MAKILTVLTEPTKESQSAETHVQTSIAETTASVTTRLTATRTGLCAHIHQHGRECMADLFSACMCTRNKTHMADGKSTPDKSQSLVTWWTWQLWNVWYIRPDISTLTLQYGTTKWANDAPLDNPCQSKLCSSMLALGTEFQISD